MENKIIPHPETIPAGGLHGPLGGAGLAALMPAHKGGLHIEHQPHKANYETIEEWSERHAAADDWVSPEQRERAIREDNLWVVQWYPETPVGFCVLCGADLETVLAAARA